MKGMGGMGISKFSGMVGLGDIGTATNTDPVKWAQRKDSLYVTILLPRVKDYKNELTEKKLFTFESSSFSPICFT